MYMTVLVYALWPLVSAPVSGSSDSSPSPRTLRFIFGQDTLFSKCLSPAGCVGFCEFNAGWRVDNSAMD